jgi:hypothetical protein
MELHEYFETSTPWSGKRYKTNLLEVIVPIADMITSPYLSGLVSMLIRNVGWENTDSVEETFESSLEKEIQAAMEVYRPVSLYWDAVMSHDSQTRRTSSLHPSYPVDSTLNDQVYQSLNHARCLLEGRTIYPQRSKKTMGKAAVEHMRHVVRVMGLDFEPTGMLMDAEVLYHKYGLMLDGPTELRSAWKYSQIKPRIYYARGPDVYFASRYIQTVFNTLLDALPTVHRRQRFIISSMVLEPGSRFFIYDYESFTSLLEEVKNFNLALIRFLRGTMVTIIDTHIGPVEHDLGEIMEKYHEVCSNYPSFDAGQISWRPSREMKEPVMIHHTCGMLGVPGNISSCTLAHGIHLIAVLQDLGCKVAGDDAAGATLEGPPEILEMLQNIGRVNAEKVESWDEGIVEEEDQIIDQSWHYLKRPVDRLDNRVSAGFQYVWPSIAVYYGIRDEFHANPTVDIDVRCRRMSNTLHGFAVQLRRYPIRPSEDEMEYISRFFSILKQDLYKVAAKYDQLHSMSILPSTIEVSLDMDAWMSEIGWTAVKIQRLVPEHGLEPFDSSQEIYGTMTQALRLATDLGYTEPEQITELVFPKDHVERFERLLLKMPPERDFLYKYYIDPSCPVWLIDLIHSEYLGSSSLSASSTTSSSDYGLENLMM